MTILTETKIVGRFGDDEQPQNSHLPDFKHFFPFGNDFSPIAYSCNSIANGIIIFKNNQTIEILDIDIIHAGRLIRIKGQKIASKECFVLFAAYLPSSNVIESRIDYSNVMSSLDSYVSPAIEAGQFIYVVGDFNADIYNPSRINSTKEKSLHDFVLKNNLIDMRIQSDFPEPTYYPSDVNKKSATLDYIFHNKPLKYRSISNLINPSSDHTIIHITNSVRPPPLGSSIYNKLFDNTKFTKLATSSLTELHNNFISTHKNDLEDPNSPIYLEWLMLMIDQLSLLNRKFQIQNLHSLRKANNKFNRGVNKILKKLSKHESPESRAELEHLESTHLSNYLDELKHSSNNFRIQKTVFAASNHRSCFSSFQTKGSKNISVIECPKTLRLTSNPLEISEILAEYQSEKVKRYDPSEDMCRANIDPFSESPLHSVLNKHNIELSQLLPSFISPPTVKVSQNEVHSAIRSFKNHSCPGPSGQGKKFFEFLFKFHKLFFTTAINQLLRIDNFENSKFAWIKNRTIIFIKKKPNKKSFKCSDFRPISLLETLYKILSKLLLEKLTPFMTDLVGPNQFGFIKNRAMSLCSITTLANIEYLREHHKDAAVIFFDIASAFDNITNDSLKVILEHIFPNCPLPQMILNLSTGGLAKVSVNNFFSAAFSIEQGSGQGDNLSGDKFLSVHHLFKGLLQILIEKKLPNIRIPLPPPTAPPSVPIVAFADDTTDFLKISNRSETETITSIFLDLKIATGLSINPSKTLIVTPSPEGISAEARDALESLGTIVESAEHLGIFISKDYETSYKLSWDYAFSKLKKKSV